MKVLHCKITGTFFATFEKDGEYFAAMGSTQKEAIKDLVILFNRSKD